MEKCNMGNPLEPGLTAPVAAIEPAMSPQAQTPTGKGTGAFLKEHVRDYGMLLSLVIIMAFFQYMTDGTLMQPLNITNLILQNSYVVIMALGMLMVIVAGHIDLSVGSVVGFIGALAAVLIVNYDMNFISAGRHAGLQGPDPGVAARPVGRPLPCRFPAPVVGLHP
jgi:putative multiple sugar transport system permease protein